MPVTRSHHFAWKTISFVALLVSLVAVPKAEVDSAWQILAPGLELRRITPRVSAQSPIVVLRIDPDLWELSFVGVSNTGESAGHTARGWAEGYKLTATINAGMFDTDGKTHLGYARSRGQICNANINRYQSVAAFDPRDPKQHSQFRMFDLDDKSVSMQGILKDYASAVQNLRLIRRPGLNQWGQQQKKWSEAALGEDDKGRILFIFSRAPFSMYSLIFRCIISAVLAWEITSIAGAGVGECTFGPAVRIGGGAAGICEFVFQRAPASRTPLYTATLL